MQSSYNNYYECDTKITFKQDYNYMVAVSYICNMNEYRVYSLLYNSIKDAIASQGLTVSKAYKKAGLKKPETFDQILEGKGRMDTIVKLCEALDLNIKIEARMYL